MLYVYYFLIKFNIIFIYLFFWGVSGYYIFMKEILVIWKFIIVFVCKVMMYFFLDLGLNIFWLLVKFMVM